MIEKRINLDYNSYLYSCDTINKCNFKNIYVLPKIQTITLTFRLSDIFKSGNKNEISEEVLYKQSIFFIYFLTATFPKIYYLKTTFLNKINNEFILKIKLKNKKEINSFIDLFFSEIANSNFSLKKTQSIKEAILTISVPIANLIDFDLLLKSSLFSFKLNKFDFKLDFNIKTSSILSTSVFKSIPSFWLLV